MEVCDLFFSSLIVLDMFNILFTDFFIIAQPGGKLKNCNCMGEGGGDEDVVLCNVQKEFLFSEQINLS